MTLLVYRNDVGEDLRQPETLAPRRRRLSTIAARRQKGRPCIVSVHREGDELFPSNATVRLRKQWKDTLVGPRDTVIITYLPLGGAMGGKGGGGGGKAIGAAVAMIALAVAAPYLIGALAPMVGMGGVLGTTAGLTIAGKVVAAGLVAGVGYFLSKATQAKANTPTDSKKLFGVSGGGNLPRRGDRIPVNYGRMWSQPDLSQPDYFIYDGDDQILFKRLTVGAGKYQTHSIRVGQAPFWSEGHGLHAPFTGAQVEFITPGQPSALVPGAVVSSDNVSGTELPRPEDPVNVAGPFPVTDAGVQTSKIQLDFSLPQGVYSTREKSSGQLPATWSAKWEYAPIDEDGNPTGPWQALHIEQHQASNTPMSTDPLRYTVFKTVPMGRYSVRAQNTQPKDSGIPGVETVNTIMWDGLRAHLFNEPTRPDVTEIAIRVSAEALGNSMTFSDVWVETTSILPVRVGNSFVMQPTRKAVWCALDVLRNTVYGGGYATQTIDLATFEHYDTTLTEQDTFDGAIRGPVSVFEAASTVLGVIRAEPTLIGDTWSMTRDEPRQFGGHVITRRQIVKDTSGVDFDLDMSNGDSDVIGEYNVDGDPNRRAEVRATIGAVTNTPVRMQFFGVSDHKHAYRLAQWYAASAFYRRESRSFTTERFGRIFNRNDPARVESWFIDQTQAAGVENRAGLTLTLKEDFTLPASAHIVIRDEMGQVWGPVAVSAGAAARTIILDAGDVQTIEQFTGRTLASLFVKDRRRLPVTVLIGTLSEVNRPYIIRSAKPDGADRAQVVAVYDAPEVWTVLGEQVPPAPPIKQVLLDEADLAPVLPYVRAQVVQKSTSLVLDWTVGRARGCNLYRVWMAYGTDGPWVRIHNGAATEGSKTVKFKEGDNSTLRIRAQAINTKGVPSEYQLTSATLFKPLISDVFADLLIELENLAAQVKKDIASIAKLGDETIRGNLKKLQDKVDELANAAATEAGTSYEARNLIKVAIGNAMAAIQEETRVRVNEDEALAQQITTLLTRMGSAEAAITQETTARSTADSALAQDILTMSATLGTESARLTQEITARVNGDGALASSIGVLQTTVGGHTATLTTYGASIDGIAVKWGVTGTIDGVTGGFTIEGVQQTGGGAIFTMRMRGSLIVDDTITAAKLIKTAALLTNSAQIGTALIEGAHIKNLTVDNLNIANGAVSNSVRSTSSGKETSVTIFARANSKVLVEGVFNGNPATQYNQNGTIFAGLVQILKDGTPVEDVWTSYGLDSNAGLPTFVWFLPTPITFLDTSAAAGSRTYTLKTTHNQTAGGVMLKVTELSK